MILENASKITPEFGVELKDVQIMRVNYVDEVQKKVFDRMIAERQRIAAKYRSEGDGKSAEIRGQKEKELKRIQSEAYRQAQEIKGKGDAEATKIYAQAYNLDPEFYQFTKTLETYRTALEKETWLLLSTDSEFLKYLKSTRSRGRTGRQSGAGCSRPQGLQELDRLSRFGKRAGVPPVWKKTTFSPALKKPFRTRSMRPIIALEV